MENSNTATQTQGPPVTEMVERVVRAIVEVIAEKVPNDRSAIDATKAAPAIALAVLAAMGEPSEAMVEEAAWAMCAEDGDWDELTEDGRAAWRLLARAALVIGIEAALEKGR